MTLEVIIPVYNARETIGRTLSSLVAQLNPDFSVTVVDDCSTDDTMRIVKQFKRNLNLKLLKTPVNSGPGPARQRGLDESTSDFVTFLDSDDMFMPYTTAAFLGVIEKKGTKAEMLFSPFYVEVDDEGGRGLVLAKNAMTWLHGKVYQRRLLEKYDIRFNKEFPVNIEDVYFNSVTMSLLSIDEINIATMLWAQRAGSITHSDAYKDHTSEELFLHALVVSTKHILKYRKTVEHLKNSLKKVDRSSLRSEEAKRDYDFLYEVSKR